MKKFPRSARTLLMKVLCKAIKSAKEMSCNKIHNQSAQSGAENSFYQNITRREFIVNTSIAAASFGVLGGLIGYSAGGLLKKKDSIAIVGGGLAGLNAAYNLQKAGYESTVYEGNKRIGGRIMSRKGILGKDLVTELGGEFIDSDHEDMLTLAAELQLELIDTQSESEKQLRPCAYFFNGRHYSNEEVVNELAPFTAKIQADIDSLPEEITYLSHAGVEVFDNMSITDYLAGIGMSGWLSNMISMAYLTEYGVDPRQLSSINLLFLFSTGYKDSGEFVASGVSDERYKIKGGNQQIVDGLANRLSGQVKLNHILKKVTLADKRYELLFDYDSQWVSVVADFVIMTLPFSVLRDIDLSEAGFPDKKLEAIRELGYGTNSKLIMGFENRQWREQGYSGYLVSDTSVQNGWDNSQLQDGEEGGFTVYLGSEEGKNLGGKDAGTEAQAYLQELDRMFPGIKDKYNNKAQILHWPGNPFSKGSYSAYKIGQWTTLAGAEAQSVGNMYFAGEHCSLNFQGFMNGAAETGRKAAEGVLKGLQA